MIEIRWHARAGQGAKSASQLLAMAQLRAGRFVQAFPEYGPERGGAPLRTFNRADDRPIRRRYGITEPDVVVVIEPSVMAEVDVTAGLSADGLLVVNGEAPEGFAGRVQVVDAGAIAQPRSVNVVMLGALAAALGDPPLGDVVAAARELFGKRLSEPALDALEAAIAGGFAAAAPSQTGASA
jgi:pyruvate ferredoxin oxidoreductase gamma subunit